MEYLVLSLNSRRLYILRDDQFRHCVVRAGAASHRDSQYVEVIELTSRLVVSVQKQILENNLVPDSRVHQALSSRCISGLRPTISLQSGPISLPMSGNLNNPSWLSICLSGACDSNCIFCFTEPIRSERGLAFVEVVEALDIGREVKIDKVVFSGGEPTLDKRLPIFIKLARERGYSEIGVQTNGHRLSRQEYLTALSNSGLSNALASLHSASTEIHDKIARIPRSYKRAVQAIENIHRANVGCTVNFVVCTLNGPLATEIIELVARQKWNVTVRFSFLIIEGAAHDYLQRDIPTLPIFMKWIAGALIRADELGVSTEVHNVPPCISNKLGTVEFYNRAQRHSLMDTI
jgi:organic radical activating enzyme